MCANVCRVSATCQVLFLIIFSSRINIPENNKSFIPISQRRDLWLREVKLLAQGHTARE